jgi:alpha-N-arabinofuranosidase
MNSRIFVVCFAFLLLLLQIPVFGDTVKINTDKTGEPISKYIYGQFAEHLGKSINGGMWAEMLQDRKFYYPISDQYDPWGIGDDPMWDTGPYRYLKASPWKVIGVAGTVAMDQQHPFTGSQSPVVTLKGDGSAAGISQDGWAVIGGDKYIGRIVLSGDDSAGPVTVRLVTEDGQEAVQTIDKVSGDFQTYPLAFVAPASSQNIRIEVSSKGSGKFAIGAISLMPADNIDGWRRDVVGLLKELNSPAYRWPGGNFVSGYNWRDGIGDRDKRPPRKNPAWKGVEPNDVGIHEFMNLMNIIGSEPYVALNTGLGTAEQAASEVEYLNGDSSTPMGKLRGDNGHPDPFKVTYFAVGNEMFGSWQLGHMSLDDYTKKHDQVTEAIWKVDPNSKLVAVGNVGDWDQTMLAKCDDHMNFLSEHIYVKEKTKVLDHVAQLANEIRRVATAHRGYLESIPGLKDHHIRIVMDEWNYWYGDYLYGELGCRYHLKDGLGVARGLHEFFRNSDLFFMANYAQTCNVIGAIKTSGTDSEIEPTGLVLKLYRNHFGTLPVGVDEQPKDLDVSAAWTDDKKAFTVGIVNPTTIARQITVDTGAAEWSDHAHSWLITGADVDSFNEPGKPPAVSITESDAAVSNNTLESPPYSVIVYRLEPR